MKRLLSLVLALALALAMPLSLSAKADPQDNTFKIATVRWTDSWPTDYLNEGVMKQMADEAGVTINWDVYYYSDWEEQRSLMLASGDLPDAFWGSIGLRDTDIAQNRSYFLELGDLIEANMPNLMGVFEKEPTLKARVTERDGSIYSLPKKLPLRPKVCGNVMYINKVWLDNLGLEIPKTYQELEAVLEKFITEDADGDGDPTNEIGITGSAGTQTAMNTMNNILQPFATLVDRNGYYMGLDNEGKPVFRAAEDNYKQGMIWLNGLYQKGIVDPEYLTQEASMRTSKQQSAQVGLITGWTADAEIGPRSSDYVLLEAVEGYDGGHYVENASNYLDIADREFVITKDCKNPALLLQYADKFYDNEVSIQTFYGSIPQYIQKNEDGTYEVLTPPDDGSLDTSAWSNSMRDFGPKYMDEEAYSLVTLPANQGDGIKLSEDAVNGQYITHDRNVALPMLKYTEEELSRLAELEPDLRSFVESKFAQWMVNGGIEEEWDGYIQQLNAMGLQELVEIHSTAFEFYKNVQ